MVAAAILARMRQDEAGPYAWVIDKDYGFDPEVSDQNEAGTLGPSNMTDNMMNQLNTSDAQRFRLCYADGEVAYSGRYVGGEDEKDMPLEDFGRPNARCSYVEYLSESGEWEMVG